MKDNHVNEYEAFISQQISSVGPILESKNPDAILAIYGVIASIATEVQGIHDISPNIITTLGDTLTIVESLLEAGKEHIEGAIITIGTNEIFPVEGGVILYSTNDRSIFLALNAIELEILSKIIEYRNTLPVNQKQLPALSKIIERLNSLFNLYDIYFGVRNNIFSISGKEFDQNALEQKNTSNLPQEQIEAVVVYEDTLYLGTNGEIPVKIEFKNPKRIGKNTHLEGKIGSISVIMTKTVFENFIGCTQNLSDGHLMSSQTAKNALESALLKTKIELLRGTNKQYKIILRTETTEIDEIKYLTSRKKDGTLLFENFFKNQTITISTKKEKVERNIEPKKLQKNEKITCKLSDVTFTINSTIGNGFQKNYILGINEGGKKKNVNLTGKEYEIFMSLSSQVGTPVKIDDKALLGKLRKKIGGHHIKNEWGVGFYIGEQISSGSEASNTYLGHTELMDKDKVRCVLGNTTFNINATVGNGFRKNYILAIDTLGEIIITHLTGKEYELFIKLINNIGTPVALKDIALLGKLRKKIGGHHIKNKHGMGYYMGSIVSNFDWDFEAFGQHDNKDVSVNDMIDAAMDQPTPTMRTSNSVPKRQPKMREINKKKESDIIIPPITLESLQDEFDIRKFSK